MVELTDFDKMAIDGFKKTGLSPDKDLHIDAMKGRGSSQDAIDFMAHRIDRQNRLKSTRIKAIDKNTFTVPPDKKKLLGNSLYSEFNLLLGTIADINNQYVGESVLDVMWLLNGNERVDEAKERAFNLAAQYCSGRVDRKNSKDHDGIMKYYRLCQEFLPFIDVAVGCPEESIGELFVHVITDYIPHFFHGALLEGKYIHFDPKKGVGFHPDINEQQRESLARDCELYHFHVRTFTHFLSHITEDDFSSEIKGLSKEDLASLSEEAAQNIQWMGSFMLKSYKHLGRPIKISDTLSVFWGWDCLGMIGQVIMDATNPSTSHCNPTNAFMMSLNHKGGLEDSVRRWKVLGEESAFAARASYHIIQQIETHLKASYIKMDHGAVLSRYMKKSVISEPQNIGTEDDHASIVVAALQHAAADKNAITKIRQLQFFEILKRLGCEIRQGKGSEISLYKPGGKHYTIGHHKRNPTVFPLTVVNILKTLNIELCDFFAALGS